jgi:hypothetical protein
MQLQEANASIDNYEVTNAALHNEVGGVRVETEQAGMHIYMMYMCVCMHICMYMCVCMYVCVSMRVQGHVYMFKHMSIDI